MSLRTDVLHSFVMKKKRNKIAFQPGLVWLSGLSAGGKPKGSLVQFPVRAHAWVVGQVPSGGHVKGN